MSAADSPLKTRQVARALGVSVSTIKRWVDSGNLQAARTVGKHRLIRVSDALRFAHAQGLPDIDLELLAGTGKSDFGTIDDGVRSTLVTLLTGGDSRGARALIRSVHGAATAAWPWPTT
jgi:excisionase family DNA binding protein